MNNHLTEDELILHYYGETERADQARVDSHLDVVRRVSVRQSRSCAA